MDEISISLKPYILNLMPAPKNSSPKSVPKDKVWPLLAEGKPLMSQWTEDQIKDAIEIANLIWAKAKVRFVPAKVEKKTIIAPINTDEMWWSLNRELSPPNLKGVSASFVFDLPDDEGGEGGGQIALISGKKMDGALDGFAGRLLAHEFGHVLLDTPEHTTDPKNIMYASRHPRIMSVDSMDADQIKTAYERAKALS